MTARGNRREQIVFEDGDQDIYCDIVAEQMRKASVAVWSGRLRLAFRAVANWRRRGGTAKGATGRRGGAL